MNEDVILENSEEVKEEICNVSTENVTDTEEVVEIKKSRRSRKSSADSENTSGTSNDDTIKEGSKFKINFYLGSYLDGTRIPERERGVLTVNSVKDRSVDSTTNPGKFISIANAIKR